MATSQTTNHGFGYYASGDVTSWLNGFNALVLRLETVVQSLDDTDVANKAELQDEIDAINVTIGQIQTALTTVQGNVQSNGTAITALQTKTSVIGNTTYLEVAQSTPVSVLNGTDTVLLTQNLPAGTYLVKGYLVYQSNSNVGNRTLTLIGANANIDVPPNNGWWTRIECNAIVTLTQTTDIKLNAYHLAGVNVPVSGSLTSVRIA